MFEFWGRSVVVRDRTRGRRFQANTMVVGWLFLKVFMWATIPRPQLPGLSSCLVFGGGCDWSSQRWGSCIDAWGWCFFATAGLVAVVISRVSIGAVVLNRGFAFEFFSCIN